MRRDLRLYIYHSIRIFLFYIAEFISLFIKKEDNSNKILIIRTDKIGDFIIFSPTIKYLKNLYPDYKLYLLADKEILPLIGFFPEIDIFIPLDVKKFQFNIFYYFKIFFQLKKMFFKKVFNPVYSRTITVDELVHIANSGEKIGFYGDNNTPENIKKFYNKFYTNLISIKKYSTSLSEADRYKEFLINLGYSEEKVMSLIPHIEVGEEILKEAKIILKKCGWNGSKFVVVHPGAGYIYRIWPIERFQKAILFLKQKGYEIVLSGGKDEKWISELIKKNIPEIIDLIGKVDLKIMAGVLCLADFYFGSETGILHLAAAVGCPTLCVLGGGHFGRFFPYGDLNKNRIVYDKNMKCMNDNWECAKYNKNKTAPCVEGIKIEDVLLELDNLINYLNNQKQ
jgi:ADP-heptose:LPS heptosyltransferase